MHTRAVPIPIRRPMVAGFRSPYEPHTAPQNDVAADQKNRTGQGRAGRSTTSECPITGRILPLPPPLALRPPPRARAFRPADDRFAGIHTPRRKLPDQSILKRIRASGSLKSTPPASILAHYTAAETPPVRPTDRLAPVLPQRTLSLIHTSALSKSPPLRNKPHGRDAGHGPWRKSPDNEGYTTEPGRITKSVKSEAHPVSGAAAQICALPCATARNMLRPLNAVRSGLCRITPSTPNQRISFFTVRPAIAKRLRCISR